MQDNKTLPRLSHCAAATLIALAAQMGAAGLAQAQETVVSDPWKVETFYENDTHYRGKDNTGSTVGLSKFRNTLQVEADKKLQDGWAFHGVFRGTYDGVYSLNSSQFGNNAGGAVTLQNTAGGNSVPYGNAPSAGGLSVYQGDTIAANSPNAGLRVLGDRWHNTEGGVAFAVPVRPCDVDRRGCTDFGGYGNLKGSELAAPEFNNRLDFLREMYGKKTYTLEDGKELFVKLGRQQVVWGRTDLFRVLDVINPVDYSRNNIYDELQDIRIPMWIVQAEYRMGASDSMQDRNLQFVWNFDQFRPNNLGQCGTPNVILDAGCFFRGMKTLWDYGGTVANFAGGVYATDFGPHQIGIRNVDLPQWSLGNTQIGVKYEGVTKDGLSFSLNALHYRSQLPSLRGMATGATNPFTGAPQTTANTHLIAFDMVFPKVTLIGGSLDLQSEALGAAFRFEGAYTHGEEFANTARDQLYSSNNVFRGVIGIDRPTFVPFISTSRTTLFSAQMFWQHIFGHELYQGPLGQVGMPDWKDNFIGTLLIKGFMMNDRLSPQIIFARDFKAHAFAVAPSVEWSVTDSLKVTVGGNFKGADKDGWQFDDCRSCNPYPPYTGSMATIGQSAGMGGFEPLGRFRAGPIGAAFKENEVFMTLRYKF